jgi:hypothetical protein
MSFLSFFGLLSPAERVAKAEEAIRAGFFEKADDQISWLVKNAHPSAAATQARLHLAKAHLASTNTGALAVLEELDLLYALRNKWLTSDSALLAEVEKESADLLISSTMALAAPAEKAKEWTNAIGKIEAGLKRLDGVASLYTVPSFRLKLHKKLVDCHTEVLRAKMQPLLAQAAKQQLALDYNGAESSLEGGLKILAGPHAGAVEAAAEILRTPTQALLVEVQQARLVAQLEGLLDQAQVQLARGIALSSRKEAPVNQSDILNPLAKAFSLLVDADKALAAATVSGMPALTRASVLLTQIQTLRALTLRCRGEHYERGGEWTLATDDFENASDACKAYNNAEGVATMTVRKSIVAIKSRKGSIVTDGKVIRQAEPRVQLDMAYRAVLLFLEYRKYDTAAKYLPYLLGKIPEAESLTQAVNQQRLYALRDDLEAANSRARNEAADFTDLLKLYEELPSLNDRVTQIDAEVGVQVAALRPYVFGRLLVVGLAQEEYLKLLDLLTLQAGFYADPEALKNVGITCLRIAVNNLITTGNYKWIISLWLTAIYSNQVLLASLERTSWDDEFTFTLAGSLGIRFIPNLLENVNHLAADSTNIALADTQHELKQRFEDALHTISDEQLQRQAVAAYDIEVNALTGLIEQLHKSGKVGVPRPKPVAPHAASLLNLSEGIAAFLCSRYQIQKEPSEAILDCALLYQPAAKSPLLKGYVKALEFEKQVVACFEPPRRAKLKTLPGLLQTSATQLVIKDYPQLEYRLQLRVAEEARLANKQEPDGELVAVYEALVSYFSDYETFKVNGAHHICDWCVAGLNSDTMEPELALQWLSKGWGWIPNDGRLAANLCIVFGRVASEQAMPKEGKSQAGLPALLQALAQAQATPTRALMTAIEEEIVPINKSLNELLKNANIPVDDLKSAAGRQSDMREEREKLEVGDPSDSLRILLEDLRFSDNFHGFIDTPKFTAAGIQLGKALLLLERMVLIASKRNIF